MTVLTDSYKKELYQFFAVAFNAAPGVTYMNQLADAVQTGNMTVQQIVNVFTTKTEFTSTYPSFYTPTQFANKIVESVVGTSATDANKAIAKADIVAALNSGMSRGDVVYNIFKNLGAKAATDADWGATATQMANKVTVAQYYTEDLLTDTTNLTTLRNVISTVTATTDVSTTAKIQAVLDVAVPVDAQSFTLTTSSDVKTLGAGADTFYGSLTTAGTTDTLNAGDNLNGAAGVDTLSISANGTGTISAVTPTLTGVEKILVSNAISNSGTAVTLDLSLTDSSLTTVGTTASSTAGANTAFTNVSKLVDVQMLGKGDTSVTFTAATVSGTGDSLNLTVNGVGTAAGTGSTFDANGIETLNITSSTSTNYLTLGTNANDATKITISGSKALTLDLGTSAAATTIDASAATAAVTVSNIGTGKVSVTGGAGNDSFDFGAYFNATTGASKLDVINGGAGNDTLKIDQGTGSNGDALFGNVSNVEILTLNGTGGGSVTIGAKAMAAGINTVTLSGPASDTVALDGTGYTGTLVVNLSTGVNTVTNSTTAGTASLTVNATASSITTGDVLTGSTGATSVDTLVLTANGNDGTGTGYVGAVFGSGNFSNFEQITISANTGDSTLGVELTLDATNVASGKTLTINAAALTDSAAALYMDGNGGVAGSKFSVTGGAGNDTIILGAGNDVVSGGAGNDSITAGAGNDNLSGGAGNDTFTFGDNLSSGDTVDGGDGTDTLVIGTGAVTSAMFTNVTNVENLVFSGNATLSSNISFTSFDLSAATGANALTLSSGYTNATTVTMGAGDSVTNTGANVALTVNVTAADLGTGTITAISGGTGVDTLNITASYEGTGSGTITLGSGSSIDVINVLDNGDAASGTSAAGKDIYITLDTGYTRSVTVDATALDSGTGNNSENLNFDASALASSKTAKVTGGGGHDTIVGGSGNDTISGGLGNDSITAGAGNDSLSGGDGNDTFVMANNLTFEDTIDGGNGTDTITIGTGTINDSAFWFVSNVEKVQLGVDGGNLTLGSHAQTAGITTVSIAATGAATATVDVSSFSNGVTFDASTATTTGQLSLTGGLGNDTFTFAGSGVLSTNDIVAGGAGTDVLQLSNGTGAGTAVYVQLGSGVTGIESFLVVNGTASTGTAGVDITLGSGFGASTQTSFNLDASALGTGEGLTFTNLSTGYTTSTSTGYVAVTIKGGAGADTITGHDKSVETIDLSAGGSDTIAITQGQRITAVDQITGFLGGTGAGYDMLNFYGTATGGAGSGAFVIGYDSDYTSTGAVTTTAFDTRTATQDIQLGDGNGTAYVGTGAAIKSDVVMVVNGATTLDATRVVSTSTALKGEFIVNDGTDAYILQAAETTSTTFNIYHVYDSDSGSGSVTADVDLVGQVTLDSGTFASLKAANFI